MIPSTDLQKGTRIRVHVKPDHWIEGKVGYVSTNGRRMVLEMKHLLGLVEGFAYAEGLGVLLLAVWSEDHWIDAISRETLEIEKL